MRTLLALLLLSSLAPAQTPDQIRDRMAALIGGLPGNRPLLNPRVTSTFERPGYRVENVVFDSLPNFRVTANLYLPTQGPGPFPAVLGVAGHSNNGKASATYQHAWISLARRGYVVLAYDPPGQGERVEYFDPLLGRSRVGTGVNEHISAGLQCLLTGASIARYFIWDGIRAFDYLLTRKEVDPRRIAVAGNSGGGTQAALLAVFEPRLAAAVSSCYITRWRELMDGPGPQDAEQLIPGFLSSGLDFVDYIKAFAPRPFLITSAVRDFFPIAGARATFEAARQHYESIDAPGRVSFFEYDDTHGWSQPRRQAAYAFLDKHLKGIDAPAVEEPLVTEPESSLWVTPTGYLANTFGSETVFSLNAALAREIYPRRRAASIQDPNTLRALIRQRLAIPDLHLAARTVAPGPKPAILAAGVPAADLDDLRKAGFVVRSLDLPKYEAGRSGYSSAYQAAAREWLHGRSLLGIQVAEMTAALYELAADPQVHPARIAVWGKGNAGVTALLTAALQPGVAKVLAEGSVTSWFAITQAPLHEDTTALIVPGVLVDFDLPDLVRLIAPRPLWLADPRTPTGARVPPSIIRAEYPAPPVTVIERPEGWPATRAFQAWLASPPL
ncbi:MAG: acetylxylan esterase [Candidatus Solibacter usitatus]|nr:acetylxylan esterase [Candidatus Solibacter usitatus]